LATNRRIGEIPATASAVSEPPELLETREMGT